MTGCEMSGNQIILSRMEKNAFGGYTVCGEDQIVSSRTEDGQVSEIITVPTENDDRLTEIQLRTGVKTGQLKILTPGEVLYEGDRQVERPASAGETELYYVYGLAGDVVFVAEPGEAIALAEEGSGWVTARNGSCIWRTERLHTANQITAIEGTAADEEKTALRYVWMRSFPMKELREILDICWSRESRWRSAAGKSAGRAGPGSDRVQLESVLYYPDREIPVLVLSEDGSAVLITGFDEHNILLMDPAAGRVSRMGRGDAAAWFEENGNRFVSYVKMPEQ